MKKIFSLLVVFVLFLFQAGLAEVRLPRLISDGMVLQRDAEVNIWGWADKGEQVVVHFLNQTYQTIADQDGKWTVKLKRMKAGGPFAMEIGAANQLVVKDIYIGEVWLCSGQSNMVLPMSRVQEKYLDVIANSDNLEIRHFTVPMKYDFKARQQDLAAGSWLPADPKNVMNFSAAAYFFAKSLYEKYHVPIGLINASVGGTPVEAWMSEQALQAFPEPLQAAKQCRDDYYIKQIQERDKAASDAWHRRLCQMDQGYLEGEKPWYDPAYDDGAWPVMQVPNFWKDEGLGPLNGVVWFRKTVEIPADMTGKSAKLLLGAIVDADSVYINGVLVGTTSYQYPPRRYEVPAQVLKPGQNLITVRVINQRGNGGFIKDKPYQIIAGNKIIDLSGEWRYQLGAIMDPLPETTFIQYKPLGLFNGMIAPLVDYRIKGVIWYQGESNTWNPAAYRQLFPALIADWRQQWQQGDYPFLFVQLANFMAAKPEPGESKWAELREAQLQTLSVSNTAMAVAIDIGEWNDVHPLNKSEVARRLALAARKLAYGEKLVHSGPIYRAMKIKGDKIYLSFTHIGNGLMAKGGEELKHFAIAASDKKFVWAKAKIVGNKVVVWQDGMVKPVAVRYAWADNPDGANLYNKEGLPASPFRTDQPPAVSPPSSAW